MILSCYVTNAILLIPWRLRCFFWSITLVVLLVRFDFIRFTLNYNFRRASEKIACKGMVIYILALNLLLKLTARTSC